MENLVWRKSSKSGSSGECVEVAELPDAVLVRDSKDPNGAVLTFDRDAFRAFVDAVREGELS